MICIVGAFFFAMSPFASTLWQSAGSILIGGQLVAAGGWLIIAQ